MVQKFHFLFIYLFVLELLEQSTRYICDRNGICVVTDQAKDKDAILFQILMGESVHNAVIWSIQFVLESKMVLDI